MSINWVMLDTSNKSFVPLPREKTLFASAPRTSLVLQTPNSYPGKAPWSIKCSDGIAYITNHRLIYLPKSPTTSFQSFQSPLLALNDTHVSAPFFGPNVWEGVLTPTPGGGVPTQHQQSLLQLKLTFNEGGAFDFSSIFERIKETVVQAAESARENGLSVHHSELDLEQLPAYEEAVGGAGARAGPAAAAQQATATSSTSSNPRGPGGFTAQRYPDEKSASSAATASAPRQPLPSSPPAANPLVPTPPTDLQTPTPINPNETTSNEPSSRPPPPNEPPPGYDESNENHASRNPRGQIREQ